ncbi:MAG TPA: SH3 domain-containing protein [Pyrinomonadaceae bacterium]
MSNFKVTADELNLREGPSTDDTIITELKRNHIVEKLEATADDKWFRVKTEKNLSQLEGWVAARFLAPADAGEPAADGRVDPDGWVSRIGDFVVERKEIKRPGNKPYFINSHTMVGVLHTTEGTTVDGAFSTLAASHSAPHFIIGQNRIMQCRPLTAQAAALRSPANTHAALQIELVAQSKQTLWMPVDGSLRPLVATLRWASGDPLNIPLQRPADAWLDDCSDAPLPWAVTSNRRRLAHDVWPIVKGWYMHMEVPGNDHWDCGALRFREILQQAAA